MSIPVRYSPVSLPFDFAYSRDKDGVAKVKAVRQINENIPSHSWFIKLAVDKLYSVMKLYNLPLETFFEMANV